MKKWSSLCLSALLAGALLAGCGGAAPAAVSSEAGSVSAGASSAPAPQSESAGGYTTTLADIRQKGTLVIGLDDTFAPMGFRDESGELVGFDIDLANAVCEQLGVTAEFQPIDWDSKEMALAAGTIDCVWNGMSITPERQEAMSLSQAYLNNKIVILCKEGVTIEAKEDLANYNIGIQAGSAALEAVQADEALYAAIEGQLTEYPTYDEVILDVQAGRLDCMIIDEVYGGYKNAQLGGIFTVAPVDFGDDLYAIGFRKADTELTQAVNEALNALIEDGTATQISEAWFDADIVVRP
ncbi:MAG TPA: amino acid ABC transporter substrate-binding protein [Candidatus Ruthenibacterium merdigallinarum]|nr:amino acid ABC transporter substrate-binding protein [Candidatus Ruthenibacterium merdigallinarum]